MAFAMKSYGHLSSPMKNHGGTQEPLVDMFGPIPTEKQVQKALSDILGRASPLATGLFGSAFARPYEPQRIEGVVPFKYGRRGERLPLTFIDKLRMEIDDWLKL